MRTIFIIPGFGHKTTDKWHKWLTPFFKKKGYKVIPVKVHWARRTLTDWTVDFEKFYLEHKATGKRDKNYVLGFSYGAMIAFVTANKLRPDHIYLCSLSPYFAEDLKGLKKSWKDYVGKRRIDDFKKYKAKPLSKSLEIPATIFCGEDEGDVCHIRCKEAAKLAKRAKLIMIPEAPHDISHPNYKTAIMKV